MKCWKFINDMKNWIPILCYHRVCSIEERGIDSASLCVSPKQFLIQMRLLKFFGYTPITVQHLVACLRHQKNPPSKPIVLTFDDGYEDNYKYAFPILKKFNFTAVIFLVTDQINGKNVWDSGQQKLLNNVQIEEMVDAGIQLGSHTSSHLDLSKTTDAVLIQNELHQSKEVIFQLTQRLDISFCYPYSRLSSVSKQRVKENGYLCAFAGDSGSDQQESDLFELKRIQVFPSTSLFGFWKKIQPWYPQWMAFQKRVKQK